MTQPPADAEIQLLTEISRIARGFARRRYPSDIADDVAQTVVLECLEKIRAGTWNVRQQSLRVLVRRIARGKGANYVRREVRLAEREEEYGREIAEARHEWMEPDAANREHEIEAFRERAMAMLPPRSRRIYELVRDGMSYDEAAQQLGIKRPTVAWHVYTANQKIRQALSAHAGLQP
jgi:RNA polymerase sigma factor (sigma-70 family)